MTTITAFIFVALLSIPQISLLENIIEKNILPLLFADRKTTECVKTIENSEEIERFEQVYPLNAQGKVSVSNVNGSIEIETWDRNEARLEYVKTADSKEALKEIEIRINATSSALSVETEMNRSGQSWGNWNNRRKMEVNYRLTVPRNAVLNEIETVNGSIKVFNSKNYTKVSTVNGRIDAVNLAGKIELSTVNGEVNASFETLENISAISLEAVNGETNITIPSDSDATIKAATVNGSINNDFNIPVRKGKYVGRDLYGQIGNGNVKINLETVNGTSAIRRKNDGKAIKNAKSLLSQKSEDSDEEDVEISAADTREQRRAMSEAQREMRAARREMSAAQREMTAAQRRKIDSEKIKRDIEKGVGESLGKAVADLTLQSVQVATQAIAATDFSTAFSSGRSPLSMMNRKSESFNVSGKPKISVEARNFTVIVRGWNKAEVSYSAYQVYEAGKNSTVDVKTEKRGDSEIKIRAIDNSSEDEKDGSVLQLFVPRNSNLQIKTNREIRIEGVSGEFDLKGENQSITLRDADGKLTAWTNEGMIRVINFEGEIDSTSESGAMNLEGDFKNISAVSDSGQIILTLPDNAGAFINSDKEIKTIGFNVAKNEEKEMWQIGAGGTIYNVQSDGGEIVVRKLSSLKSN